MSRSTRRSLLPGYPLHVIQRGHNRDACFRSEADHILYLGLLEEASKRHGCAVHAYVLMGNHVHLVVTPPEIPLFSRMMKDLNQGFAQYINRHNKRCGSVWQGRPKTFLIDSQNYLLTCHKYIELNPVRAGMVAKPWLYPWSSYSTNASGRKSSLIRPHAIYSTLGKTPEEQQAAYRRLFEEAIPDEVLGRIRASVNRGKPLGDEAFVMDVAGRGP